MIKNKSIVAICVATYMRQSLLKNCLASIAKIKVPKNYLPIVIVVDNDKNKSGEVSFDSFKNNYDIEFFYYVEPERGISSARNCLLEKAMLHDANLIGFIDDDEFAHENWLLNMVKGIEEYQVDIAAGPVIATYETSAPKSFERDKKNTRGATPRNIAAGNVLFKSELAKSCSLRFDRYFDFMGGEDFDFFSKAKKLGMKSVWLDDAIIFETITSDRRKLKYIIYRHFTGGINLVMRYRKDNSLIDAWCRYLPKMIGKLLSAIVSLITAMLFLNKSDLKKGLIRLANGVGYLFGLTNIIIERYKY